MGGLGDFGDGVTAAPQRGCGHSPAWAGSWPEPPPESRATRPCRASRSARRATRCPRSSRSPGLQATSPASVSSAQPATEPTSFLGACGHGEVVTRGRGAGRGASRCPRLTSMAACWDGGSWGSRWHWGGRRDAGLPGSVGCPRAVAPAQPSAWVQTLPGAEGGQGPAPPHTAWGRPGWAGLGWGGQGKGERGGLGV